MEKLLTILKLLPAIIAAIKAIEEAIPAAGKGSEKLEAVREIIETVDGAVVTLWPQIAAVVGVLVGLFNKTGVFAKAPLQP
jgi:hypothetical protein